MTFENLGMTPPILAALAAKNLTTPTPIQLQAIPLALEGRDVVGLAQTGTGKTAAFALPILKNLSTDGGKAKPGAVRALILSPTRELAAQIHQSLRDFGKRLHLRTALVVGGVSIRPQKQTLSRGVDILVATPGRLLDLMDQNAVRLGDIQNVVLDEADQMLDIGFLPAINRIMKLVPAERQTMLFSATMPKEIRALSARHLTNPAEVSVVPAATPAEKIDQSVTHLPQKMKSLALSKLAEAHPGKRIIVFTRTKHGADKVVKFLAGRNFEAAAIHGNKSQGQRQRALDGFKKGTCPILIATDIAARGIDVPGVELVVNYELPDVSEVYVHRIGRTARAGASGAAISFCSPAEVKNLRGIERLIKRDIRVASIDGVEVSAEDLLPVEDEAPRRNRRPSGRPNPAKRNGPPRKHNRPKRGNGGRNRKAANSR